MAASDFRRARTNGTGKPRRNVRTENSHHRERQAIEMEVVTNDPDQLPQDERAENGLIDSAFDDREVLRAFSYVKPHYFSRKHNAVLWRAMQDMEAANLRINEDTLRDYLLVQGNLDEAGGELSINRLGLRVSHSGFAREYARIVCQKYFLRVSMRGSAIMATTAARGDVQEMMSAWTLQYAEIQEIAAALNIDADGNPSNGPRHRPKTLAEMRARPRPEWLIPGYLMERKRSLIFGDSNTGKSFIALDTGLSIATGTGWHGRPVKQGVVVYICAEDAEGVMDRVDTWLAHHGLSDDDVANNFLIIDDAPNLIELGEVGNTIAQIKQLTEEPPALIIFDTLAASMPGGNENDTLDMGIVIGAMHRVQRECGAGVMAIHHKGKDPSKGPRGSNALRADVDEAFEVNVEETSGVISMSGDKMRGYDKRKVRFAFRLDERVLERDHGLTSCILVATDEPSIPAQRPPRSRKSTSSDKLVALMQETDTAAGRQTLWSYMALCRRFMESYDLSKSSFDKALGELLKARVIVNLNGGYALARRCDENTALLDV